MIEVRPWIVIDGQRITCDAERLDIEPVVAGDLKIKWGRDGYLDGHDPATLTVTLFDSVGTWARRVRESTALGARVDVRWSTGPATITQFSGSITAARARQITRRDDKNRRVWTITLTVVDPTGNLSGIFPLPGVLQPTDTMEQRKQWLKGLLSYGGIVINDIDYQSGYANSLTCPVEVGDDSAYSLVTEFYDSMSRDAFTFDPEGNSIRQCERHDWDYQTSLASFDDSRGAVLITASDTVIDYVSRPGVALSACRLEVDQGVEVEATTDTGINIVETTWKDPLNDWKDGRSSRADVAVGEPRRVLKNDTWMTADWAIELQLQSAWDRVNAEGARPRHPDLVYRPGHEFATERMARWWLRCWEDTRPAFINGDAAHHWLTDGTATPWPPLVSPLGGEVTYNGRDGWTFSLNVQWMNDRTPVTPMTWSKLQQLRWTSQAPEVPWWWWITGQPTPPPVPVGSPVPERDVRWGAPDGTAEVPQYRFDESTTWADMRYLDDASREIKDILT